MTTGEGGCLVLNDGEEARRCALWRLQGVERSPDGDLDVRCRAQAQPHRHRGRIGLGQLARLEEFNARRARSRAAISSSFDRSLGCELPLEDFEHSNWHMFQIVLPPQVLARRIHPRHARRRHRRRRALSGDSLLSLLSDMGFKPGDFPNAERIGAGIATLPLFPAMREAGRRSRV